MQVLQYAIHNFFYLSRYEFWQLDGLVPFFYLTATKILKQLVVNGALNNNRSLAVLATIDNSPKLIQATCSMK